MKYYLLIISLLIYGLTINGNVFAGVNQSHILQSRTMHPSVFENGKGKFKSFLAKNIASKNEISSLFHKSMGSPNKVKGKFWDIVLAVLVVLGVILSIALIIALLMGLNYLIGIILFYPLYIIMAHFFYFLSSIPLWVWVLLANVILCLIGNS